MDPKISWEGHSAGFIAGLILALYYRKQKSHLYESYLWQRDDFDPEQDAFIKQFDENGQFRPLEPEIDELAQTSDTRDSAQGPGETTSEVEVQYNYKPKDPA